MKFVLKKIDSVSGGACSFYDVCYPDGTSLFTRFIAENQKQQMQELMDIAARIRHMGKTNGAAKHFFKPRESEGNEERLMAIYDPPDGRLRVYCLRISSKLVILGGGGYKPPGMRKWQESSKLSKENRDLELLMQMIDLRLRNGEIRISNDGLTFTGKLDF